MTPRSLRVLFAPDWREGVPYQALVGDALQELGITVSYLSGYKRALPLYRLCRSAGEFDLLHLHWPEAYYPAKHDGLDWFRSSRFAADITLTARFRPLVVTAHNLHAHNRGGEWLVRWNHRVAFRRAAAVLAHSDNARELLIRRFGLSASRVHVIPHGDLSAPMPPLPSRSKARASLQLGQEPICLMFGEVKPYKGIEEILRFWREHQPPIKLVIAGRPLDDEYGSLIAAAAKDLPNVALALHRLGDDELGQWLAAADCVLFNYQNILTSGAAALTRSLGIPVLLPRRCETVDLGEPDERVIRFGGPDLHLKQALDRAVTLGTDHAAAADWRATTAWPAIAQQTASVYRSALR